MGFRVATFVLMFPREHLCMRLCQDYSVCTYSRKSNDPGWLGVAGDISRRSGHLVAPSLMGPGSVLSAFPALGCGAKECRASRVSALSPARSLEAPNNALGVA